MEVTRLIILGYKLALMTFYLGVLVYALPLPWRGIKQWAPRLIGDSITAFILITLYFVLVEASNKVPLYLGGSWDYFDFWISRVIGFAIAIKELVILAYAAANVVSLSKLVSTILWPIDRLANVLWLFVITIYGIATLVRNYYYLIVGLGLVLYSVPFRIGRSAGAWLIAFGIVFNAGLPVLPAFVSWIYDQGGVEEKPAMGYGLIYSSMKIVDATGGSIEHGILHEHIRKGQGYQEVGRYNVVAGKAYSVHGIERVSLPSSLPSYYKIEVNGVIFPLVPFPLNPSDLEMTYEGYAATLTAVHIVWHYGDSILFTSSTRYSVVEHSRTKVIIRINMSNGDYVEVRAPTGCQFAIRVLDGQGYTHYSGGWEWLNVTGEYSVIKAEDEGEYLIEAVVYSGYEKCASYPSLPEPKDYFLNFVSGGILIGGDIVKLIIIVYLTMPTMYLLILSSIAYGLARMIGGRERFMPRIT